MKNSLRLFLLLKQKKYGLTTRMSIKNIHTKYKIYIIYQCACVYPVSYTIIRLYPPFEIRRTKESNAKKRRRMRSTTRFCTSKCVYITLYTHLFKGLRTAYNINKQKNYSTICCIVVVVVGKFGNNITKNGQFSHTLEKN